MKKPLLTLLILLTTLSWCIAQHHDSPSPTSSKVVSTSLLEQLVNDKGIQDRLVKMETVEFPPLYSGKPHRHPCPLFAYVLEGELESVFEGQSFHYKMGDSFYEKANGLHESMKNLSKTQSAKLLIFYISEKGATTYVPEKN